MISIFHIDFTALTPHISDKSLNNLKFTISHVYAHEKIFIPCDFIKAAGNKVGLYTHYLSKKKNQKIMINDKISSLTGRDLIDFELTELIHVNRG